MQTPASGRQCSPEQYADKQYLKAVHFIQDDPRVQSVGLVNFDTQRMEEILDSGVKIVSNQVQFSLVDLRPTFLMGDSCKKHNVKLLTYGSLVSTLEHIPSLTSPTLRLTSRSAEVS